MTNEKNRGLLSMVTILTFALILNSCFLAIMMSDNSKRDLEMHNRVLPFVDNPQANALFRLGQLRQERNETEREIYKISRDRGALFREDHELFKKMVDSCRESRQRLKTMNLAGCPGRTPDQRAACRESRFQENWYKVVFANCEIYEKLTKERLAEGKILEKKMKELEAKARTQSQKAKEVNKPIELF